MCLIAVSLFDDCADSPSVFFSACMFDQLLWECRHAKSFCPPTPAFSHLSVMDSQSNLKQAELPSAKVMSRMQTQKQDEETEQRQLQEHAFTSEDIGTGAGQQLTCRLSSVSTRVFLWPTSGLTAY